MNKKDQKPLDWGKKKIPQFLIWDYIENMHKAGFTDIQDTLLKIFWLAMQKYKIYKIITDPLDKLYNIFFLKSTRKKVLFVGSAMRYPLLFREAKKDYNLVMTVEGKRDRLFAIRNLISYVGFADLSQFVYCYFKNRNPEFLKRLLKRVEDRLRAIDPDLIVLWNDVLPIERSLISICRKMNIPTIDIQHGIYQINQTPIHGITADYVLVWGKTFQNLYLEKSSRKPDSIYILGYPYNLEPQSEHFSNQKVKTVYYFDQNIEAYKTEFLKTKLDTLKRINKVCKKLNVNFICRLHPSTDKKKIITKLPAIKFASKNETLKQSLKSGDLFISLCSTALVEAAMRFKPTIQLIDCSIKLDNYEDLGIVNKTFNKISDLESYLTKIFKSSDQSKLFKHKFNNQYINLKYDAPKRFMEIIDQVLNQKSK